MTLFDMEFFGLFCLFVFCVIIAGRYVSRSINVKRDETDNHLSSADFIDFTVVCALTFCLCYWRRQADAAIETITFFCLSLRFFCNLFGFFIFSLFLFCFFWLCSHRNSGCFVVENTHILCCSCLSRTIVKNVKGTRKSDNFVRVAIESDLSV